MTNKGMKILPQITIMNAVLCLFVVMIHLTFAPIAELNVNSLPHIMMFSINKWLCFCVPAFIFLSGFKLFESYKSRPFYAKPFLVRRLKKIVLPYMIAVLIYMIYFGEKGWLEDGLFKSVFLGTVSAHFYYIVVLVQLYLLFPIILKLFKYRSRLTLFISLGITLFCLIFLSFGFWDRFFGTYVFYFVFGMFWAKYDLYRKFRKHLKPITITYFALLIWHILKLYLSTYSDWGYRLFPVINAVYVVFAIILLYAVSEEFLKNSRFIVGISSLLSNHSYSIYLYHCLAIFILKYDVLPKFSLSVKWNFFFTTLLLYSGIFLLCAGSYLSRRRVIK